MLGNQAALLDVDSLGDNRSASILERSFPNALGERRGIIGKPNTLQIPPKTDPLRDRRSSCDDIPICSKEVAILNPGNASG